MKASSESGECASLISTGSLSVFEAVCGPGMGLFVSFSGATLAGPDHFACNREAAASPWLALSQRDFPTGERVFRRRTEENVRVAGACVALGRAISCKRKPSILVSGEQLGAALGAARAVSPPTTRGREKKRENAEQDGDSSLLKRYNARSLPSVCGPVRGPALSATGGGL